MQIEYDDGKWIDYPYTIRGFNKLYDSRFLFYEDDDENTGPKNIEFNGTPTIYEFYYDNSRDTYGYNNTVLFPIIKLYGIIVGVDINYLKFMNKLVMKLIKIMRDVEFVKRIYYILLTHDSILKIKVL